LTISPEKASAILSASSLFPDPVGPTIATNGRSTFCHRNNHSAHKYFRAATGVSTSPITFSPAVTKLGTSQSFWRRMTHDADEGCHTQGDRLCRHCSRRWLAHGNSSENSVTLGSGDGCRHGRGVLAFLLQPVTPKPRLRCAPPFFQLRSSQDRFQTLSSDGAVPESTGYTEDVGFRRAG